MIENLLSRADALITSRVLVIALYLS